MITLALKRQSGGSRVEDWGVEAQEEKGRQWSLWQEMRTRIRVGPVGGRNKVEIQGISLIENQRDTWWTWGEKKIAEPRKTPRVLAWVMAGGWSHPWGRRYTREATQTHVNEEYQFQREATGWAILCLLDTNMLQSMIKSCFRRREWVVIVE